MSHNSRDELSAFDELNESGSHSERPGSRWTDQRKNKLTPPHVGGA